METIGRLLDTAGGADVVVTTVGAGESTDTGTGAGADVDVMVGAMVAGTGASSRVLLLFNMAPPF